MTYSELLVHGSQYFGEVLAMRGFCGGESAAVGFGELIVFEFKL